MFDVIAVGDVRGPVLVGWLRREVDRELASALETCDEVPECYLDAERAKEALRALAADGDESWARGEVKAALEMEGGCGVYFDRLMDHVNCLTISFWRLNRAEKREMGRVRG